MSEIIRINNFGGIKEMEMELKPINVIIGPQASGKSVTAKLLYFFKSFYYEIFQSILDEEPKRKIDSRRAAKFLTYFPLEAWPQNSFKIEYEIGGFSFSVENKGKKSIGLTYSKAVNQIIESSRKHYKDAIEEMKQYNETFFNQSKVASQSLAKYYYEELNNTLPHRVIKKQLFVPAGRSFFSNIQSSIFSLLHENNSLDPFLIEFGSLYESLRNYDFFYFLKEEIKEESDFYQLIAAILNGKYLREKGKDYLVHADSRRVSVLNASSGQQETLPLVLVLKSLFEDRTRDVGTLYIEEPEAHVFPVAQKRIVQLLTRTYNRIGNDFQIVVTTHSPYLLATINNLMEAGKILNDKAAVIEELNGIIPKEEVILPDEVAAYALIDGVKTDLIDPSTKLISQNILDSVSDEISIEFGKLLDLEF